MILLVCKSRKLHNISHFSLLARLMRPALIFSQEATLIFHKILERKIAKRDLLSTLLTNHNAGLVLQKITLAGIFTRIKRKLVKFIIFYFKFSSFSRFSYFAKLLSFVISAVSRNCETCETRPSISRNTKIVS